MLSFASRPPPLRQDEGGTVRVGATRVSLDSMVVAFENGMTPEQVVQSFPTLDLADVFEVFATIHREREAVAEYVREREASALPPRAGSEEVWRRIEQRQAEMKGATG